VENDGDSKCRTGGINNADFAHAQRKIAKSAANAFRSSKYSTSSIKHSSIYRTAEMI